MFRSRHKHISIIYVQHTYNIGVAKNIFDTFFHENATYVVLFENLANTKQLDLFIGEYLNYSVLRLLYYLITARIFGENKSLVKKCQQFSEDLARKQKHNR
jgi:hypothetical protein